MKNKYLSYHYHPPGMKIRWEVLDWSAYHTTVLAAAPRLRLNTLKSKIRNLWKKVFFLLIFSCLDL